MRKPTGKSFRPRAARAALACVLAASTPAMPARAAPVTAGADTTAPVAGRVRTVAAGEHYRAGSLHRFLLGRDYRHLWTAPVEIDELDMGTFAGGLEPVRRVGGQQTHGLALKGADGRDYTFRGLDKDPSDILPPEFHGTIVDRLLQDQIASSFPGGALAVAPLLEAAGVLHATPVLVVLPDDPRLGEFRADFAGVPGTLEEYPRAGGDHTPGFAGALEIINGEAMWQRMDESPATRPDSRAFLTARLVDLLVGDWDRHRGQWRWARLPDRDRWQPIPEDRDQAFVRFEGVIPAAGRHRVPQFVSFGDEYPGIVGLTWNGRDGDRRILVDLEKPEWDRAAAELQAKITDGVIDSAVARLPEAYRALEGDVLAGALRERRDALPEIADRFYRLLARDVDIHATSRSDIATVARGANGEVEVAIAAATSGGDSSPPYYRRVFHPDETSEVRIYLEGGDDRLVATGEPGAITVRVIGGDGDDAIDDSAGTGLKVSDASGDNRVTRGRGTKLDTRRYTAPPRATAPWIPPRDWGRRNFHHPWIGGSSDLGLLLVAGMQSEGYGFRKDPYADRQSVRLGYATRAGAFGADYRGQFHRENSQTEIGLYARISGLDFLHYYGFGNETEAPEDEDFYKVKHTEYVLEPSLTAPLGPALTGALRISAKYTKTDLTDNRYIAAAPPYGSEEFFQAGAGAGIALDTRDSETMPARGVLVTLDGTLFPEVGKVKSTFGEIHGEVRFYQPIPVATTPVIALRAGGKQIWGTYPYHEAASIGGSANVRGFAQQRFLGDAAVFAGAELRIPLSSLYLFVPGRLGVFALGDVGRVFVEGESSKRWHGSVGGGLWFSLLYPGSAISLSVADSDEGTRVYLRAGLAF